MLSGLGRTSSASSRASADSGIELAMGAIATRSGVGAGTLYRHFSTRESLVAAVWEGCYLELEREE